MFQQQAYLDNGLHKEKRFVWAYIRQQTFTNLNSMALSTKSSAVRAKHSSFQYFESYTRDLIIFSTKYCGFVPLIDFASFTVLLAIFKSHRD